MRRYIVIIILCVQAVMFAVTAHASPTFVSTQVTYLNFGQGVSPNTVSISYPPGCCTQGQVVYTVMMDDGAQNATLSNFTRIASTPIDFYGWHLELFRRVILTTGSFVSETASIPGGTTNSGIDIARMRVYANANTAQPEDLVIAGTNPSAQSCQNDTDCAAKGPQPTALSMTPKTNGDMLIDFCLAPGIASPSNGHTQAQLNPPAGYTNGTSEINPNVTEVSLASGDLVQTLAASTGNVSCSGFVSGEGAGPNGSSSWDTFLIALAPAPVVTSVPSGGFIVGAAFAGPQSSGATTGAYQTAVMADHPSWYWRLNEPTGSSTAVDSADSDTGTYINTSLGNAGSSLASPDTAAGFNGTSSRVQTATQLINPGSTGYTQEVIANVTSGACPLVELNSNQTANGGSDTFDRQLYIGTDGKVYFGNHLSTINSLSSYFGAYHHFVGTWDATNLNLYVDGFLVAGPTPGSSPVNYNGWWTLGGAEEQSDWPNSGGTGNQNTVWCNGRIQEVAIYPTALSSSQVYFHATGTLPTLQSIAVTPNPATIIGLNNTLAFTATGTYSNNGQSDITSGCTWTSSSPTIATITSTGVATSHAFGGPINIQCTHP